MIVACLEKILQYFLHEDAQNIFHFGVATELSQDSVRALILIVDSFTSFNNFSRLYRLLLSLLLDFTLLSDARPEYNHPWIC